MNATKTWLFTGALALALGAGAATAEAKDPSTKVKVGKDGVHVQTGNTKVDVSGVDVGADTEGGSVDVETDDEGGESVKAATKGAAKVVKAATEDQEGAQLSIVGNGKKVTHVCGGDKHGATVIDVTGNGHEVTLKGPCESITVTGNGHKITIEQIGTISATGNKIAVKWRKALHGDKPEVTQVGNDILISKIKDK